MTISAFFKQFPTEESCKAHFKQYREKTGVVCKKCQGKDHYWLSTISYYKCKNCGFRTSLKSGTVMENSKLPYQYWYMAFLFATTTKKSFSALEIQKQIDHKFYEPIWFMMHKIRNVMGKRDAEYQLEGCVEIDEAFMITTPEIEKDQFGKRISRRRKIKPGKGSPRTATVLVMAESFPNTNLDKKNKHQPNRYVKHIKMIRVDDNKAINILPEVKKALKQDSIVTTDGANHYNGLKEIVKEHHSIKLNKTTIQAHEVLPWVHKVISNAKRNIIGIHHSIGKAYTQNYLNEFCFRFNRRYNEIEVFDRLMNVAVQYQWAI